ncbi:MAG TPA: efflux RND transporter periplasmic adaptor subunit [Mariprofundaceae bacterium]|nr:efflux RND transporter periplasmic adaptor subunit [Mariprofundaceae bacterium]
MNKQTITVAGLMLLLGLGAGYVFAPSAPSSSDMQVNSGKKQVLFYRNPMNPAITSPAPAQDEMGMDYIPVYADEGKPAEKKVLFYRNPMNPAITSPAPAQDEMGMDYIPVYADGGSSSGSPVGTVTIDGTVVQNMAVRTTIAKQQNLSRDIRTIGRVTYDEERVALLHPKYEGWVEQMFVDKTGEYVSKDTMLMSIYSPQLVATQEEYLLALNNAESLQDSPFKDVRDGAASLLYSARERLELLDVPTHQIKQLNETRKVMKGLHIHSPFAGIVMKIGARDGQRITPNTELYKIADLSRVWVTVDLYEDDMPWVQEGDKAEMQVAGIPGRIFKGKVTFIYPYLEAKTRTLKVRLEFDNPELALKPEMFANVVVNASKQFNAVVVPLEAIIRTGEQEQVFVQRGIGKFEPRTVTLGVEAEGLVQIISGLNAGEQVVTSGQFLIDSESKLQEATAKMMESLNAPRGSDAVDMQGMDMSEDIQMDDMNMDGM